MKRFIYQHANLAWNVRERGTEQTELKSNRTKATNVNLSQYQER